MIDADDDLDGTWPWAPRFSTAAGFRQHYVDEGSGPVVLCLHGMPTWGYLYRAFVRGLAADHRVVVPDHMGFGKSETPPDGRYTARTHVENLAALVEELDLRDVTLVGQDWGGVLGCAYAARHPDRVARLFLANTLSAIGDVPEDGAALQTSRWFEWVIGGLETGRTEQVLSHLGSTVLSVMKLIGFERSAHVDDTWIRAYSAPFATPEECLGALAFPRDALGGAADFLLEGREHRDALAAIPAMLAEGMADRAIPPALALADFRSVWPQGVVVELPGVGHFCQEDAPDVLVALLRAFVQQPAGAPTR